MLNSEVEIPTNPKTNKVPVWFLAKTDGNYIYIESAKENKPSSKISCRRKLTFNEFKRVYPIHLRRENGEAVSTEATKATRNQVYYFSLIKYLNNEL